jgi:short-subunit dehydrogenase
MGYFRHKVVWITGASSGIGLWLMKLLADAEARLIVTSSNQEKLAGVVNALEHQGSEIRMLPGDLSAGEIAKKLASQALEMYGKIDVLILNAGKSQRGLIRDTDEKVDREIMELDYFSNILIVKTVLNSMKLNGGGQIAVTSSITGKFGFPLRSAYAAAKHALHGFFETLYLEEKKNNIFVTIVCPGRIKTEISKSALQTDGTAYDKMDAGQLQGMSPEVCARKYLAAIKNKKREVYIGKKEILMVHLKRFFPSLFFRIAGKIKTT